MKHQATRDLYQYWQNLRGKRSAPDRSEIEPADIRHLLGHTFILEVVSRQEYRFRLAGTKVCALYGREMKGKDFAAFWERRDREAVATMLSAITSDAAATVMGLKGRSDHGRDLDMEVIMLPLRQRDEGYTRILGSLVAMDDPFWIGIHPIMKQSISSMRLIWPDENPTRLLKGSDAPREALGEQHVSRRMDTVPAISKPSIIPATFRRQVQHLTVYDGGKE
jgi:hypothetical protein